MFHTNFSCQLHFALGVNVQGDLPPSVCVFVCVCLCEGGFAMCHNSVRVSLYVPVYVCMRVCACVFRNYAKLSIKFCSKVKLN